MAFSTMQDRQLTMVAMALLSAAKSRKMYGCKLRGWHRRRVAASAGMQNPPPTVYKIWCSQTFLPVLVLKKQGFFNINQTLCCPVFLMRNGGCIILRAVRYNFSCNCWKTLTVLHLFSNFSLLATSYDCYTTVCIPCLKNK